MGKKDKKKDDQADPAPAADAPPTDGPPTGEGGDGEIVGGPRNPQQIAAQKRLQQTQAQVDEVVDIMRTNVEKVLERDQKLSELDDRADALQQGASQFEQQAGKLKRKFWLQNLKMMIIMGVIGLVIVAFIARAWVMPLMSDDDARTQTTPQLVRVDPNDIPASHNNPEISENPAPPLTPPDKHSTATLEQAVEKPPTVPRQDESQDSTNTGATSQEAANQ